jgi:hypothetical protein
VGSVGSTLVVGGPGRYPRMPTVSQRRKGSRKRVNKKGERVSPCRVPRFMSMDGVGPYGVM